MIVGTVFIALDLTPSNRRNDSKVRDRVYKPNYFESVKHL
jgi:hypothetical protein